MNLPILVSFLRFCIQCRDLDSDTIGSFKLECTCRLFGSEFGLSASKCNQAQRGNDESREALES